MNAVNAFAWTGADGVTWTARLVGCDENTPGTYAVEAVLDANDERAGSLSAKGSVKNEERPSAVERLR